MKKKRIIARIDVKNEFAIKGIHLEGLRKVGNPNDLAKLYYKVELTKLYLWMLWPPIMIVIILAQ